MKNFSLLLFAAIVTLVPQVAHAWNFSCSPRESTTIPFGSPNVLVMLDRSGSMDDAEGEVPQTCRVCEVDGSYIEVPSAVDCIGGIPWSVSDSNTYPADSVSSGYAHNFTFAGLPPAVRDIELAITIRADLNGECEWADVFVDGDELFVIRDTGDCVDGIRTFTVPASYAADGEITVDIVTAPDNNGCDGQPATCAPTLTCDGVGAYCATGNYAAVTLTHSPPTYHGTQSWADPCGIRNKWEQAVAAIERLTFEAQSAIPEAAYFGLGLFHESVAVVHEECEPSNHDDILAVMNGTWPNGLTPMARAIRAARQSDCVIGPSTQSATQEAYVPMDGTNTGYDISLQLGQIFTTSDVELEVVLFGDYGNDCEFASVVIDGVSFGTITDSEDCRAGGFQTSFTVPATFVTDNQLSISINTRADGEVTAAPACDATEDGVDAQCATNGARVTARWPSTLAPATATILVTDGLPTMDINGVNSPTTNYLNPIQEGCQHRDLAPMFVVGLGAATDEDYNNILSAAAGTGTCFDSAGTQLDPCDDMANWADLRGLCSGSIQASSGDDLLAALSEITASLACTFRINLFNSGHTAVPEDPTNEYPYLWVDGYDVTTGSFLRIPHHGDPAAVPPGEGWEFATEARLSARLSDYYCDQVQNYTYSEVGTHLACLCQEEPGAACDVPDWEPLQVCPTGTWSCTEGTDWCNPDLDCCIPGVPCLVEGLLGECANGQIVCDSPLGSCHQVIFPTEEICDGLDNDCDGLIDEIGGDCTVPNQSGRCAVGTLQCDQAIQCLQLYQPMPELCNGLDDDCDGAIDNMFESWKTPAFLPFKSNATAKERACRYLDVCMCPVQATDDHAGGSFSAYVAEWDPVCACVEGLAPAAEGAPNRSSSPEAAASCASASGSVAHPLLLLLLVAARLRRPR